MRIAVVTARYPALSETFVQQDIDNLRALGHEVTVVALRRRRAIAAGAPEPDVVAYKLLPPLALLGTSLRHPHVAAAAKIHGQRMSLAHDKGTRAMDHLKLQIQILAAARLALALHQRKIEHVHCHFAHAPTTVGMIAAQSAGIPVSFTGHANDLFQRRVLLSHKLREAAFVACISEWHRAFYQGIVARPDSDYPIIRCGINTARFAPTAPRERDATSPLRIITIARLVAKKGIDTLLRSVAALPAEHAWELRIIGDGPERQSLESLARELALTSRVTFAGAFASERVPDALREADMFVLPCRVDEAGDRDGIPVAMMEAMASGLPVIAGDLPTIRELVEHERTGLLVDGTSPQAVSAAIARLANAPHLAQCLAEHGRAHVVAEFNATVHGQRLSDAIVQAHQAK